MFVDLLSFTLVLPSLPFRVGVLGGGGIWLGVLLTSYSVSQAAAAPVLGRLADRHGRRRLLLLSLAGTAVSLAVMGAAGTLWVLLPARVVAGICGGSIGVAQAFAADLSGPQHRTKAMGQVGAAIGLAFTAGPALGALAAPLGFDVTAYIAAALAAGNLVQAWKTLPAGRPPATGTKASPRRVIAPWPLLVAGFATMAAFVGMETTLAFLAAERFGAGPGFVGILLCLAGAALFLVQGLLVARASRRWGETRVALAGAVAMAAGLGVLPFAPMPFFVVAVVVLSAGDGLVTATVASMLAGAGPPGQRGARMGQGQSVAATARALGPLGSGVLFDVGAWLPYAVGAVLSAGVAVVVNLGRNAVTSASGSRAETTDRSNSQPGSR
ncbi:MFS transporter [Amycolatopsis vastitatis]|uniref:MFS transporter n=1 Tax=Amycolatopsis vastitatis TaxID=1905142 RepID=UPI0013045506|nr:MFS transporter [Amycolatopsis vastitatis]